jgi:hypothetical protein
MNGLIESAGKYRKQGVGIARNKKNTLPHENVPHLMKDLFKYLKDSDELTLIKVVFLL